MGKKYKLTQTSIKIKGTTLYQIQALRSFGSIKEGDFGGWIEHEGNLSHSGSAWIRDNAQVYNNVRIRGNAQNRDNAQISGNVVICDSTLICHNAEISEDVEVSGYAQIRNNAQISGRSQISGDSIICGNTVICNYAEISGDALISGDKWESSPLYIQGSKHSLVNCKFGHIKIGCKTETFSWWQSPAAIIFARNSGLTESEIKEYKDYIDLFVKFGK